MPTNKIVLRSTEQFMSDYTPVYQPLYPLFLGGKSQQYDREAGKLDFRRLEVVGDIRAKHITPKDTEIRQVSVMEGKKTFRKYFLANQFILSQFQDQQGVEEVTAQVLDEHQIQMDEMLMLGDGTAPNNVLNNGLYYSGDSNYTLESSVQIALTNRLYDFHRKVMVTAAKANQIGGRKVIIFYGTDILPLYNSIYDTAVKAWKVALGEVLGNQYSTLQLPEEATPAGANGWIIANVDQVKFHYTVLPELMDQGINAEQMYLWSNFLLGSCMLEVLIKNAVIRQPATLET